MNRYLTPLFSQSSMPLSTPKVMSSPDQPELEASREDAKKTPEHSHQMRARGLAAGMLIRSGRESRADL
ncbi:MAG: hypothetical protein GX927_07235 [Lentisphaerae bacterium]|nr:hypothetical protein [Lentisphaerota bacterium]